MKLDSFGSLIIFVVLIVIAAGYGASYGIYHEQQEQAKIMNFICPICHQEDTAASFNYDNPKGVQIQVWCHFCGNYFKIEHWDHTNDSAMPRLW